MFKRFRWLNTVVINLSPCVNTIRQSRVLRWLLNVPFLSSRKQLSLLGKTDFVVGKSGYQCARSGYSRTGKNLWPEVNLRQGVTPTLGISWREVCLCEKGIRVERWLWGQQHQQNIERGDGAVRSYGSLPQKMWVPLYTTCKKPHSLYGLFFIKTSVCNHARGQHPDEDYR